jgi:isochorismate hydrolase
MDDDGDAHDSSGYRRRSPTRVRGVDGVVTRQDAVMPRIDADSSLLLVIDAQDGFYPASRDDVDQAAKDSALARAGWVCGVAASLEVPVLVTVEDPGLNGATAPSVARWLPHAAPLFTKVVFGAFGNADIAEAVEGSGRSTVVIVGMETDVCVAHTALGAIERGLRPVVVHDAVFSAGDGHRNGLARLAFEGIEQLSAKELYYEWLRELPRVREFDRAHPDLATPPGFSL